MVQKIFMFFLKRDITLQNCKNSLALGPNGPKHYIFGNHFYFKNVRKLIFHVFLNFCSRKHMTSSIYLTWIEFTRNFELFSNCGSPGTRTKLEQIHKFLWIRITSAKIMSSYVFLYQNGRMYGIWSFWHFLSKTGRQKYSAWVSGTHFMHMRVKNSLNELPLLH